jgi:pyruvate formate lyase activating enzyme
MNTMTSGVIFDIARFAIHDGPGIRTTVFFKGCPLSCWWCHNPESQSSRADILYREYLCVRCGSCVDACPRHARSLSEGGIARDAARCAVCGTCAEVCPSGAAEAVGRSVTADDLVREIERDTPFFDESGGGVTFSGGEPLSQPEFLREILGRCGEHDIHRTVDTCGFAKPEVLRSVAEMTDLFLFDLKLMDADRHVACTGVGNDLIIGNLKMLSGMGAEIQVRVPVIPTITDAADNIDAIGEFVSGLPRPPRVTLLAHHPAAMEKYGRFRMKRRLPDRLGAPSSSELEKIASRLAGFGLRVAY